MTTTLNTKKCLLLLNCRSLKNTMLSFVHARQLLVRSFLLSKVPISWLVIKCLNTIFFKTASIILQSFMLSAMFSLSLYTAIT